MPSKAKFADPAQLKKAIAAARGQTEADVVLKNGRYLDVFSGEFKTGDVAIFGDVIVGIQEAYEGKMTVDATGCFIVPGFIDSHVHIESSLMTPARFQQAVLPCGTTSVIWDPHEITNVKGTEGIQWALESSEGLDLDVFVMVPSCVPSTTAALELETSGAELNAPHLRPFRSHPRVLGLAEMMNFPGLLSGDDDVLQKLTDFNGMRRDGHCPGLSGKDLNAYGVAGIHSCHESTALHEAQEKLSKGIHVLIREGSCAKDADELLPLLNAYTSAVVGLCSDDRNPLDIDHEGHIDAIVNKALKSGHRAEDIFRAASFGPARAYGLDDRGAVAPGYRADLVLVKPTGKDWGSGMSVAGVWKSGRKVDKANLKRQAENRAVHNQHKNMNLAAVTPAHFHVPATTGDEQKVRVIGVMPRKILTENQSATLVVEAGQVMADSSQDVLKIAVLERHHGTGRRTTAFVRGFGLKKGAIATSINHDSHNVITVGASDEAITMAVNRLREIDGGIVVVDGAGKTEELALPLGGLMTDRDPAEVTQALIRLKAMAKALGCPLEEPFLQLSFLALPVIPSLKISDRGLVDVDQFKKVSTCL